MTKPHILVTTDFSKDSVAAFAPTALLARKLGASVTLLAVVEDHQAIPHGAPLAPPQSDPELPQHEQEAAQKMQELTGLHFRDMAVATRVLPGADIAKTIVGFAEQSNAAFLVIASRGWSGTKNLFGSTAEAVLKTARIPVLMVPVGASDLAARLA